MKSAVIKFSKTSTHAVSVRIYETRAAMRSLRTRQNGAPYSARNKACDAYCWQANRPGADNIVAEIHLAKTHLSHGTIVHECVHAAYHRVRLMGFRMDDNEFEEYVATAAGLLSDTLLGWCDQQGMRVKLDCVPGRRVITTGARARRTMAEHQISKTL